MKYRLSILVFLLLVLSGCSGEPCIDADDFGFANLTVSARYSKEELDEQYGDTQVGPWNDSGYRVNGRPLVIMVRTWEYDFNKNNGNEVSAWCPWYGLVGDDEKLSNFCERLPDCRFIDDEMCTNTKDARIANAPCIMRNGVGLYALIADRGTDPNQSLGTQRDPAGLSFHLGQPTIGYTLFDLTKDGTAKPAGGVVYQYNDDDALKQQYADAQLYFKILDKFYDDNSGQYRVTIKSGVGLTNPDPISYVIKTVKDFMFGEDGDDYGLIQRIYQGIIDNAGYRFAVSGLLTLYVMYTAMAYLLGFVQLTTTELVLRVMKIALISVLINTTESWDFFYNNLFVFFVGGVQQVLDIIMEAGATGPGAPGILAMMIAPQTFAKLFSLLWVDPAGYIYIALFFFALYFVISVYFQAAVLYLVALITIGLIIVMAPVFICFLLFNFTRSLFENWLRQIISYAVQPIILFTGLIFIAVILRTEIYGALGFRVCKQYFPELNENNDIWGDFTEDVLGVNLGPSLFYWYFPEPMKGENFLRTTTDIPIPIDHFTDSGDFCEAYGCIGARYPDLPFLDPVKDTRRLSNFWNGVFVQFDGLILIFIMLYLLKKFNQITVSMARYITGTSGNLTDISSVRDSSISGFRAAADSARGYAMTNTRAGRALGRGIDSVKEVGRKIKAAPGQAVDTVAVKAIKKSALSRIGASRVVLDEVQRSTGLRQQDIEKGSLKAYKTALSDNLKSIDPTLTSRQAKKIAGKMSHKNYKQLSDEFAKAKFGKKFDKLSNADQKSISDLLEKRHNGKTLKSLAARGHAERRFKEAYLESHQRLSNKGVDIFGKRVAGLRSFQEARHKQKMSESKSAEAKRQMGANVMTALTGSMGDIDMKDPARRTYGEEMQERRIQSSQRKMYQKIDMLSKFNKTNVTSPEFIAEAQRAGDRRLDTYKDLAQQDVSSTIHNALYGGSKPILKGEKYMMNHAKDSELVTMIDKVQDMKETMFGRDQFISREDEYMVKFEEAKETIDYAAEVLGPDVTPEEMPGLWQGYLEDEAKVSKQEALGETEKLKKALEDFERNQEVINQINERKAMIADEINKEVDHLNDIRHSSGMEDYQGKGSHAKGKDQYPSRPVETLTGHLKGLKKK